MEIVYHLSLAHAVPRSILSLTMTPGLSFLSHSLTQDHARLHYVSSLSLSLTLNHAVLSLSFFFTLVTGPRRSLSLKLSDARVYEPQIRARLGTTAHCCEVVVLKPETLRAVPRRDRTWRTNTRSPKPETLQGYLAYKKHPPPRTLN